jgi:hypothetical protein
MEPDGHGRPTMPVCGISTEGLWFRRDHVWAQVPERQRCRDCEALQVGKDDELCSVVGG